MGDGFSTPATCPLNTPNRRLLAPRSHSSGHMVVAEQAALAEFEDLLRTSSQGHNPPRHLEVRYQVCRTMLMTGEFRSCLPGFVQQCISLPKFREFICLYDFEPQVRLAFIDEAMAKCRSAMVKGSSAGSTLDDF